MFRSCIVWTVLLSLCLAASQGCRDEKTTRSKISDKYAQPRRPPIPKALADQNSRLRPRVHAKRFATAVWTPQRIGP